MSKASPTTYKIGSIGEFAAWTKEVLHNPEVGRDAPRQWFDSEALAEQPSIIPIRNFDDPQDRRRWLRILFARARANARKKGMAFNLTLEFVETLWKDGRCAVTGEHFNLHRCPDAFVKHPFAPSIDRTLSNGGYTKDNVRLVCAAANFGMGQWGDEVFLKLAQGAVEHQREAAALDANWQAGCRERIAAAQALLSITSADSERTRLRRRIAALKRALTLGPAGLRAAASKAKATRRLANPRTG